LKVGSLSWELLGWNLLVLGKKEELGVEEYTI
jgi:hypothetical protein